MEVQAIADRQFTIETYLARSGREALPLELGFIQGKRVGRKNTPGPLAEFIRRGRETALEQYLLAHSFASSGELDFDVRLPAFAWARATGGYFDPDTGVVEPAALHGVSRNWKFIRGLRLISTERVSRLVRVTLLADDGSGEPYRHLGAGTRGKKLQGGGYLQLPYAYWRERWHERLTLPAKAMLLISLYQGDGFPLPLAKVPLWYGISVGTAERGFEQLVELGLLHQETLRRPDVESPVGFSYTNYYELRPPFGPAGTLSGRTHPDWIGSEPTKSLRAAWARKCSPARRRPRSSPN
jgi:hypothetical protein